MTDPTPKKSDLGVRAASAVVMVAVAGAALWLGGWVWTAFVALVALGVLWEWRALVAGFETAPVKRGLWYLGGLVYVGLAAFMLAKLRLGHLGIHGPMAVIGSVVATDIGAYFAGRSFGGPKIAPRISPSKTWAGLIGGILGASIVICTMTGAYRIPSIGVAFEVLGLGALIAIIAQTGDFFESWMKRRAGVKDSGNLIPGHGGLFDRVDGLLAVCFVLGLLSLHSFIWPQ